MPYRHIFFDLDHTLWDFEQNSRDTIWQLYNEYKLEGRGIMDFNAFYQVYRDHNERLWERFRNGFIKRDELRWKRMWHTLLDFKIGDTKLANELSIAYLEILPTQRALMPHALETLQYCKEKYTLHIITNGFETTQRQKLHYCGITHYFDQLICSEKSNSIKPQKAIFDYALQAAGAATTEECIMIGDALEIDIAGARNAGWSQVYFNCERIAHSQNPTYEISCLSELKNIL